MRWIIYDGDVDAVCHCVEMPAISPKPASQSPTGASTPHATPHTTN